MLMYLRNLVDATEALDKCKEKLDTASTTYDFAAITLKEAKDSLSGALITFNEAVAEANKAHEPR